MARETDLWAWLKQARQHFGTDKLHMHRIENSVSYGMPDVEGHLHMVGQFWIELKCEARPKRPTTPIRFKVRASQIPWNETRWNIGGWNWFLCQVGSGHERELYLVPGCCGQMLLGGITEQALRGWAANRETRGRLLTPASIINAATNHTMTAAEC